MFTFNEIATNGDIITSTDGEIYNNYQFDAFGKKIAVTANDRNLQTVTTTASTNPIGYRNYYFDSETGLYYLKARYYDSITGQFTQEDTVQDDNLQYNLYGYCSANPIAYTDPSGHKKYYEQRASWLLTYYYNVRFSFKWEERDFEGIVGLKIVSLSIKIVSKSKEATKARNLTIKYLYEGYGFKNSGSPTWINGDSIQKKVKTPKLHKNYSKTITFSSYISNGSGMCAVDASIDCWEKHGTRWKSYNKGVYLSKLD